MSEIDCCFYWAGGCEEGSRTKKCSDRNCYYKQLKQLKQENEYLQDSLGLANKYVNEYKATLDEIEKVVANNISNMDTASTTCAMKEVLQLIKQAKDGE